MTTPTLDRPTDSRRPPAPKKTVHHGLRARRRRERWWAALFLGPQMVAMVTFTLVPFGFAIVLAFMKWDGLGEKSWVGLDNFRTELADPNFRDAVLNTLTLGLLTVPAGLALALFIAIALNNVRGKTIYRIVYFLPVVTSSVAVSVIWQILLASGDLGMLNNTVHDWFGITLPDWLDDPNWVMVAIAAVTIWSSVGLNVVIFLAGLQSIPAHLGEVARIDGAGKLRVFRHITLPLLSPTIFFSFVIAVISSFQAFDQIYVLVNPTTNEGARTIVFEVYDLGFKKFQFGVSSAAALMLTAMTIVVTLAQFRLQKRFVHYES